ncbi:UNVERIFIED_CONTAM: hypothetical protein GTU68_016368 [Idotea baltica]|nr:hypothetical protein [Idotea baltica]
MALRTPIIAILGRPNVGKSSLFNRIYGRQKAIVEDQPGVTRDRNYAKVDRYEFPFYLVDTGGFDIEGKEDLSDEIRIQARLAAEEADHVLVVFDASQGVQAADSEIIDLLRSSNTPRTYLANKCDGVEQDGLVADFYSLGVDEVVPISALHRRGVKELVPRMLEGLPNYTALKTGSLDQIRLAIIGRPNVGKSTLVNTLLGERRAITSDIAGTTRDSLDLELTRDGQDYVIVDTAGLRKKARISEEVERFSTLRSLRAINESDVSVILLDATQGPTEQDAKIVGLAHDAGRGIVLVVNKWDAIEKDHKSVKKFKDQVRQTFKFTPYAPIIFASALSGKRCPKIVEVAKQVAEARIRKIPTAALNETLTKAMRRRTPPVVRGRILKLFYASQVEIAPPRVLLFFNYPQSVHFSYLRFLKNAIREDFDFPGCDIKLVCRKRERKA